MVAESIWNLLMAEHGGGRLERSLLTTYYLLLLTTAYYCLLLFTTYYLVAELGGCRLERVVQLLRCRRQVVSSSKQ